MRKPIYLDFNATTPIDPEVADAMKPFLFEYFGNPSSSHSYGIQTKSAIEEARKQVAELLNCQQDEVIFTSGGSESNNMAIKGVAFANRGKGNHIITSKIEHPAVLEVCKFLENNGFNVTYLPVNIYGIVRTEDVERAIRPETILVTIMHANNEVGSIQPIKEIAAICKNAEICLHTDAAQSVAKVITDVQDLGVDMLSVAGHKLYSPKGIGALYIKHGTKIEKLIHGADHELDRRAGTENVLEIVGLGKACEIANRDLINISTNMRALRDFMYEQLLNHDLDFRLNGHPELRLPNTLSIGFKNIDANTMLYELQGVAASAGAACHTGDDQESSVLSAMQVPDAYAMGTIRFSLGKNTTREEITRATEEIAHVVKRMTGQEETKDDVDISEGIKLTHFTHGLGCACKLRPQDLEEILQKMPGPVDPNVLVGHNTSDDAAVYRLSEEMALVQTVDFFTPVIDDPYQFGAIAAANSLSDIYAMGAKPLFALNIVAFPAKRLPMTVLEQILSGGRDKVKEAGIEIIGGHTIEDNEPKYGLVVSGIVNPEKIWLNSNAQPGDVIILTKPVGTGILSTALKRGLLNTANEENLFTVMSGLNKTASQVASNFRVNACTDVTGFGLTGHLKEMTQTSKVNAEIFVEKIPVIDQVKDFASANIIPGGTENNMKFVEDSIEWDKNVSLSNRYILCDAQTSGGLLLAIPPADAENYIIELHNTGNEDAAIIGRFTEKGYGKIFVK